MGKEVSANKSVSEDTNRKSRVEPLEGENVQEASKRLRAQQSKVATKSKK